MKKIDIQSFIRYNNDEMSPTEKRRMESFLKANPHYVKMLRGLTNLQQRLGPDEDIEQFLEKKKNAIKPGIFRPR